METFRRYAGGHFDALVPFNPILHGGGGGGGRGGAQSARANFKDSYLRNEHCYSNEISKPTFDNFNVKFLKMHFYFKFFIEMLTLNRIETFSMFLINFWLILRSFKIFQKIQDGDHEINTASYDVIVTS